MKRLSVALPALLGGAFLLVAAPAAAEPTEPRLNITFICKVDKAGEIENAGGQPFEAGEYVFRITELDGAPTEYWIKPGGSEAEADPIEANGTRYLALPKGGGYSVQWDGGSKGTASTNEMQICELVEPDPEPGETDTEPEPGETDTEPEPGETDTEPEPGETDPEPEPEPGETDTDDPADDPASGDTAKDPDASDVVIPTAVPAGDGSTAGGEAGGTVLPLGVAALVAVTAAGGLAFAHSGARRH